MGLLYDLSTKYKTLSIVGMAKNAGKTTALNYLIEEAIDEGILLGVTSTGRDGESQDLVTGTENREYIWIRICWWQCPHSSTTWPTQAWK